MFIAFLAAAAATVPQATAIDVGSWFSAGDYPVEAQRKGIEGTATFEVDVDASGKPTACRITKSSGSPILDQKTCEVVLARGRFKPAMRHGMPIPGRYRKTTAWRLEGTAPPGSGYFASQQTPAGAGKCKDGESKAESEGCV
jgi:TonB family protein